MFMKLWRLFLAAAVFTLAVSLPGLAQESFFKGKTIRVIVGFSPGGGFDTYSRAIARHLGRHVPGNPTVIVENMTGAGSLVATNHMYQVAKPDGLTIGNFSSTQIVNQAIGAAGIEFDARKFEWIGVPVQDSGACALTKASGITSLEKWKEAKTPVKLGGLGPGDVTYTTAKMLKDVLGLPVQVVVGYKGTADVRLAAESGELAGGCWQWESIKVTWRKALESGDVNVVLQTTARAHSELPKIPLATSLAKTDEARVLLQVAVIDPNSITRPYALPPGTPKERTQLLRKAFMETMADPEFLAETKKSNLDIDPLTGEEVEKIVARFFKLDSSVVTKLREIMK
jgi:tripartite-type tricarboxylate transporter receptor subunit TctC